VPTVAAAVKWVDRRPEVDPLTGAVTTDARTSGMSEADRAAVEWALRLGERWSWETLVVTAGPPIAESVLRDSLAAGVDRAVRVDCRADLPSPRVAAALAPALSAVDVVVCGDWSLDRGSGSVPAFLAADLGAAQALGVVAIEPAGPAIVDAERRLDGGRRERLRVTAPAVISVEGASARLRRASLSGVRAAQRAPLTTMAGPENGDHGGGALRRGPLRPRPKVLPPPDPSLPPRDRILALTGSLVERTPPQRWALEPSQAAERIIDQLRAWGVGAQ